MQSLVREIYTPSGYVPLDVRRGDVIEIERRDDEWPLWLWCSNAEGAGWVPEAFMEIQGGTGTLLREYTSREIAVEPGEQVDVVECYGGWAFVRTAEKSGWILERCIEPGAGADPAH